MILVDRHYHNQYHSLLFTQLPEYNLAYLVSWVVTLLAFWSKSCLRRCPIERERKYSGAHECSYASELLPKPTFFLFSFFKNPLLLELIKLDSWLDKLADVDKYVSRLIHREISLRPGRRKYEVQSAKERSEVGKRTKLGRQKNEAVGKRTKWYADRTNREVIETNRSAKERSGR